MEKKIWNLIILDASGSMSNIRKAAASGVQETIVSIRESKKEHPEMQQYLTFIDFSNDIKVHYEETPIDKVRDFVEADYNLRGCTALYDAIGISVTNLRRKVAAGDNVLVTIITDGYENASKSYSAGRIKSLIEELKAQDWVFTFIGTDDIDVESVSASIGIKNHYQFAHDDFSTRAMFEKERRCRRMWNEKMARGERAMEGYFDEEPTSGVAPHRITPERIERLMPNEVFVFGSDISGSHSGGAARAAVLRFGAVVGQAEGPQGQSYAIPTTGVDIQRLKLAVDRFIYTAQFAPDHRFLVTRIGCGNAGWSEKQIAILFADAVNVPNITLPASFWAILKA